VKKFQKKFGHSFNPKFQNRFAVRFIVPKLKSQVFKLKLDELGSAVGYHLMGKDGRSIATQLQKSLEIKLNLLMKD